MQSKVLINFLSTDDKKKKYAEACAYLGTSVSDICRKALDNAVALSEKLKTPKTMPEGVSDSQLTRIKKDDQEATQ